MPKLAMQRFFAVATAFALCAAPAMADTVAWTDWDAGSIVTGNTGSGAGQIDFGGGNTVGVTLNGPIMSFVDGTSYYAGYPATYGNLNPSDLIREQNTGTVTLAFDKPVTDLYLAIVSQGAPNIPVVYGFNAPFSVESYGPNQWGYGGYTVNGNVLTGKEFNGILKFAGTFSSLSFDIKDPEFWHGFNVGAVAAVPEPETLVMLLAGLGLIGFMRRRSRA